MSALSQRYDLSRLVFALILFSPLSCLYQVMASRRFKVPLVMFAFGGGAIECNVE